MVKIHCVWKFPKLTLKEKKSKNSSKLIRKIERISRRICNKKFFKLLKSIDETRDKTAANACKCLQMPSNRGNALITFSIVKNY